MLSDQQRERLVKREELKKDKMTRQQAYHNDMVVKRLLEKFLTEDIIDAALILMYLPREKTREIIAAEHIVGLFDLIKSVLWALNIRPLTEETLFSESPNDVDAARASLAVLNNCNTLCDRFGPVDSIGKMLPYHIVYLSTSDEAFSNLYDRLTDDEKRIFDRIREIIPRSAMEE